jgi:hypothetical protein
MELTEEKLPKELFEVINTGEFEDDGDILIIGLDYQGNNLKVKISVDTGIQNEPKQLWELAIWELKKEKIELQWTNQIKFFQEHYLLWEFTERQTSLYFNGKTENPAELLTDIFRLHRQQFGHWYEVEKYLNNCLDLYALCKANIGLFARGPKRVLEEYYAILEKYNKNPHFHSDYNPEYENYEKPLGLLIIGESFFIGEEFSFKKIT